MTLAVLSLIYFVSTSIEDPPGPGAAGPSSVQVPNNAEPSRIDAPPAAPK
jgi:hypothetical protein